MQAFKYVGYDATGDKVSGEIVCGSVEEAERKLSSRDFTIIAIAPAGGRRDLKTEGDTPIPAHKRRRVSDADAAAILENLAVMAETGVPFIEALEAVANSARTPNIAAMLHDFRTDVVGGKSVSSAMRMVPGLFPPLVADMVRVAEEGGRLDQALRSAAAYLGRAADLRKRIVNAMMYPMVMFGVSLLTIVVLILFVIPRFAQVFKSTGAEVPATTQIMLNASMAVKANPIAALVAVGGVVLAGVFLFRLPVVTHLLSQILQGLPAVGPLIHQLALSRAFQSISTLLSSNVSIMAALEHGSKVAGQARVRDALMRCRQAVEHGKPLSEAMADTKVFPKSIVQMVMVGEKSGRLAPILATTSNNLQNDVDARLKSLVSIIEPLMIVSMGAIVGGITISIISPIYSVIQNIK